MVAKRDEARKAWEEKNSNTINEVAVEDVADVVSMTTGVPVSNLTEAETEKLLRMEQVLHERVIGQDEAVTALSKAIRRSRSGLKDPKRPWRIIYFPWSFGRGQNRAFQSFGGISFQFRRCAYLLRYVRVHGKALGVASGWLASRLCGLR